MPFTNMSDGRNFTDYRPTSEAIAAHQARFGAIDSTSLRYAMQQNAEDIMTKPGCTPKEQSGMTVLCGGPISQYLTEPNKTEFGV